MVTDAQKQQFREEGYFLLEDVFTAEEMDTLAAHIDAIDEEHQAALRKAGQQGISIPDEIAFTAFLHRKHPDIEDFIKQQRWVDITTALLGPDVKLYWDQSVYKRPEAKRDFPWHQDTGYVKTEPLEYVTCWLAVNDATLDNGCIWIQPRSHHQGLVEHTSTPTGLQCYFGDDPGTPVPLRKGSMAVFSSLLFHRSGPNRSQVDRKGYVVQYSVTDAKNAKTGAEFENGPVIARNGQKV